MKLRYDNSIFDTCKAKKIFETDNGLSCGESEYMRETLYKTKSDKYFLHGEGGESSIYAADYGYEKRYGEKIIPLTKENAFELALSVLPTTELINLFGQENVDILMEKLEIEVKPTKPIDLFNWKDKLSELNGR